MANDRRNPLGDPDRPSARLHPGRRYLDGLELDCPSARARGVAAPRGISLLGSDSAAMIVRASERLVDRRTSRGGGQA